MPEKPYGVAVHGAGDVSTQHVHAYLNNPHTKLVAISSRKEESAKKLADSYGLKDVKFYTDFRDVLDDPDVDIVSICTPQQLHAQEVVLAAEARKHMLIEKPVAITLESLHMMRDAVRRSGVKTVVSFVLRWNTVIQNIKALLSKDYFGKVFLVETDFQSHAWEPVPERWEWVRKKDTGVSAFLVAGVHAIDMARWLAVTEPNRTANIVQVVSYAGGYRRGKHLAPFIYPENPPTEANENLVAMLPLEYDGLEIMLVKFDNGALGKISANFDAIMPYNFGWELYGDKGTCKQNRVWSKQNPRQSDWITLPGDTPGSAAVGAHPFQAEIDHLVDCIINGRESHANLEDAVNTHEAALAAIISREEGNKPIKLPLTLRRSTDAS